MSRRPIVAIDFDDTIAAGGFPDISKAKLIDGASEFIHLIKKHLNCDIIIWTCRSTPEHIEDAKNFLKEHNISYDYFNENSKELEFDCSPKIYYDHLIDDKCFLGKTDWFKVYKKTMCKIQGDRCEEITNEMIEHHFNRTECHIDRVKRFYNHFAKDNEQLKDSSNVDNHDLSKYEPMLFVPYVKTNWERNKNREEEYTLSDDEKKAVHEATIDHVIYSRHHPEYSWAIEQRGKGVSEAEIRKNAISENNRDESNQCLTINNMSYPDICEMCADWCAMSVEFNNTPMEWADKQLGVRWDFGEETHNTIREVLEKMWEVSDNV